MIIGRTGAAHVAIRCLHTATPGCIFLSGGGEMRLLSNSFNWVENPHQQCGRHLAVKIAGS